MMAAAANLQFKVILSGPDDRPRENGVKWIGGPVCVCVLQRGLSVRGEDHGQYAVSVQLRGDREWRFFTPRTPKDTVFWLNGLDGQLLLSDAFALFESPSAAGLAIHKYARRGSKLFRVDVNAGEAIVTLRPRFGS